MFRSWAAAICRTGQLESDVNADAKFDPLVLWDIGILFRHTTLNFIGTPHGVNHASELDQSAIASILDDMSTMIGDFGIEKRLSERSQSRQRAFFIESYKAARANNIGRQNSRQAPLYVLVTQDAPIRGSEQFI